MHLFYCQKVNEEPERQGTRGSLLDDAIAALMHEYSGLGGEFIANEKVSKFVSWLGKNRESITPSLLKAALGFEEPKDEKELNLLGFFLGVKYVFNKNGVPLLPNFSVKGAAAGKEWEAGFYFNDNEIFVKRVAVGPVRKSLLKSILVGMHEGAHALGWNIGRDKALSHIAVAYALDELAFPLRLENTDQAIYGTNSTLALLREHDRLSEETAFEPRSKIAADSLFDNMMGNYLSFFVAPWVFHYYKGKGERLNIYNFESEPPLHAKHSEEDRLKELYLKDLWHLVSGSKDDLYDGNIGHFIEDFHRLSGIKSSEVQGKVEKAFRSVAEKNPITQSDFIFLLRDALNDEFGEPSIDGIPDGFVHSGKRQRDGEFWA